MKKNLVVRRFVPRAACLRAAKELQPLRCQGLRPYSVQGTPRGLRMAERPVSVLPGDEYLPLVELAAENGTALILKRGETLGVLKPGDIAVRRLVEINIGGEAICALQDPADPTAAIVMVKDKAGDMERGYLRLRNGFASWRSAAQAWPALSFTAEDCGSQSAACGKRKIAGDYSGSTQVWAADARGLSDELTETYERLVSGTHAAGYALQPLLLRYRLLDSAGRVLHESPAHYLEHPAVRGSQLTDAVAAALGGNGSWAGEYEISARVWRPVLNIPAGLPAEVAAVEVLASPEFHPMRPGAAPQVYISRKGQDQEFRISLPGSEAGVRAASAYGRARLGRVAADMARTERRLALISTGDGHARSIVLNPGSGAGTALEAATALERVHSGAVPELGAVESGKRLTAGLVARRADVIVWGKLEMRPFEGWTLEELCAERSTDATESWEALVAVEFADGTSVERRSSGHGGAPLRLRPLIGYPHAGARKLSVYLIAGTRSFKGTFELTADPAGKMALWVDVGLQGPELSGGSIATLPLYSLSAARRELIPDGLAVCSASAPAEARMLLRTGGGELRALSSYPAGAQTWDFGRQRFVAGTARGLYMLSCTDSRHWLRHLDGGEVARPDAIAGAGDEGTYAICGGRMLHIDSRGHCSPVAEVENPGKFMAWLPRHRQLLLDDGRFYDPAEGTVLNILSYRNVEGVLSRGAENQEPWLLRPSGGVQQAGNPEDVEAGALCVWTAAIEAQEDRRPRTLILDMSATELKGTLRVEIPRGSGQAAIPLWTGEIEGAVSGPLRVRLRGRFTLHRGMTVALMLMTASADFEFHSLTVEYDRE